MKNLCFLLFFLVSALSAADAPVLKDWSIDAKDGGPLRIVFRIPSGFYAYAEGTSVRIPGFKGIPSAPAPDAEGHFPGPGEYAWTFPEYRLKSGEEVHVNWQVCREARDGAEALCMMPQSGVLTYGGEAVSAEEEKADGSGPELPDFRIVRTAEGYLSAEKILSFLSDDASAAEKPLFAEKGLAAALLLALLGGLALNLTPCVLPLIPVNLAVIGAGAKSAAPRRERILRGILYGAGIACAYGLLGIFAVFTGTAFGALDSSWLFQYCAALVFLLLGLSMFGIGHLDFSGIMGRFPMPSAARRGGVFLLGALSAALAGACVAPVIAAALLQASRMAASGDYTGLFLPFLVGVGMALPWPFLAAGFAFLPKPGAWMNRVKYALGVLIVLLSAYYFWTGTMLLMAHPDDSEGFVPGEKLDRAIAAALEESGDTGKPVLLDFGASWCKACVLMENGPLKDPAVEKALENVVFLKIRAEKPSEQTTAALLRTFQIGGMPSFVLIVPDSGETASVNSAK